MSSCERFKRTKVMILIGLCITWGFMGCGETKTTPKPAPAGKAPQPKTAEKPVKKSPVKSSSSPQTKPAPKKIETPAAKSLKTSATPTKKVKTVRVAAWCLIYGAHPYKDLAKAKAQVNAIQQAGLGSAHVFDTREFLNLARGELVVIGAMNDEEAEVKKAAKRAKKAKFDVVSTQCRSGEFDLPIVENASDIKPTPKLSSSVPAIEPGDAETGCWGWSHVLRAGLCMSGEEILGNTGVNGWRVGFVGQKDVKDIVLSRWGRNEPAPENTRALSVLNRKQLSASVSRYEVVKLGDADDLVRGDELAFASPRVRFRYRETKMEKKTPRGMHVDYSNTLEVKCGKAGTFTVLKEWESTEPASAHVWPIHGSPYFLIGGEYTIGREGQMGSGYWAIRFSAKDCKTP